MLPNVAATDVATGALVDTFDGDFGTVILLPQVPSLSRPGIAIAALALATTALLVTRRASQLRRA